MFNKKRKATNNDLQFKEMIIRVMSKFQYCTRKQ